MIPEIINIYLNKTHNALRDNGLGHLISCLSDRHKIRTELRVHFSGLKEVPKDLLWVYKQYDK